MWYNLPSFSMRSSLPYRGWVITCITPQMWSLEPFWDPRSRSSIPCLSWRCSKRNKANHLRTLKRHPHWFLGIKPYKCTIRIEKRKSAKSLLENIFAFVCNLLVSKLIKKVPPRMWLRAYQYLRTAWIWPIIRISSTSLLIRISLESCKIMTLLK